MGTNFIRSVLLASASAAAAAAFVPAAAYAQDASYELDIPAQPLGDALRALGRATKHNVVFDGAVVRGKRSTAVKGRFSADAALERMLDETGLVMAKGASGSLTVRLGNGRGGANLASSSGHGAVPPSSQAGISEILVVGSKSQNVDIRRTEDDPQPYVVFDNNRISRSGANNIEDFLSQQLTMNTAFGTNSQNRASPYGTTSSINLRGLGANETLVLVDGRRLAGVSNAQVKVGALSQPDINGIPLAAVDRIEILPSSASAIYGGAALGGVINIILKRDFNGGQADFTYGNVFSGSAPLYRFGGRYGFHLGENGPQIMLSGTYSNGSPLKLRDRRELLESGISTKLNNSPSSTFNPLTPFKGATPNIVSIATFSASCGCSTFPNLVLKDGRSLGSPITYVPAGSAPGDNISAALLANAGRYNLELPSGTGFGALNSNFGSVPETLALGGTIRQRIGTAIEVFADISYNENNSRAQSNPFSTTAVRVSASAPTNPFNRDVSVIFPSDVDAEQVARSKTVTFSGGAVVEISPNWKASLDYTQSRNTFSRQFWAADTVSLRNAINAGTVNPFVDTISSPQPLSNYLNKTSYSGDATLRDIGFRASGTLGSVPGGKPVLTIGLDHRVESIGDALVHFDSIPNPASNYDLKYLPQSQTTDSIYSELRVPFLSSRNHIPLVYSLELQIAGRLERYTVSSGTLFAYLGPPARVATNAPLVTQRTRYTSANPTVALKYEPFRWLALRSSYATAFLPPTANQLLPNPAASTCGGFACLQIVDPQNGATYFVDAVGSGNSGLKPQKSENWNFGFVVSPNIGILKGLRISLDHYSIVQPNYIILPNPQDVINDHNLSDRLTRDPSTGLITTVDVSYLNATIYKTAGWDLAVGYDRNTTLGDFEFILSGTKITHDRRQLSIGGVLLEYAGFPNDGGSIKFRGRGSVGWRNDGWQILWSTTYTSGYGQLFSPGSPSSIQQPPNPSIIEQQGGTRILSQAYHDVFFAYDFRQGARGALNNLQISLSIKNLFNKRPPYDAFGTFLYSPVGSPRLREFQLSLRKNF